MSNNQHPGSPWDPNSTPQNWGSANPPPGQPQSPQQPAPGWDPQGQQGQQGWNQQQPYPGQQNWQGGGYDPNAQAGGTWSGQQNWTPQGAGGPGSPGGPGGQYGSGGSGSGGSGKGILIGVIAAVVVVALGLTFFLLNRNKDDGEQAVPGTSTSAGQTSGSGSTRIVDDPKAALEDYFDAVMKGDPKRALSYGRNSPSGSSKYLTADVMNAAQKQNPIKNLTLDAGTTTDYSATVNVSYDIAEESVTSTYRLSRSDKGSHWQMSQAAANVDLSRLGGETVKINGQDVSASKIALFPGGYTLESGNEYVQYGNDDSTLYVKEPTGYVSTYDMAPALTTKGLSTWRSLVKDSLSKCLASTKFKPEGCPFYVLDKTSQGTAIQENSVTYSTSSAASVETMTPRLTAGTMQAVGSMYMVVRVTAKTANGGNASGTATVTSTKPTVDFSAETPAVTWPTS